jgi:hypothetical protein
MDIGVGHKLDPATSERRDAASITNPTRGTAMALFKELTDADGNKIIVNVDAARFMQWITDATTKIYFGNDDAVKVKETPAEILMLTALKILSRASQLKELKYAPKIGVGDGLPISSARSA